MIRVGLIGCGAIGSALAQFIQKKLKNHAKISNLYDKDPEAKFRLAKTLKIEPLPLNLSDFCRTSDWILEAAAPDAARAIIPLAVRHGKPAILLSGGGVVNDPDIFQKLLSHRNKFYIPSGAVAAIDGLLASQEGGLTKVTLTTSKSMKALEGALFFEKFPKKKKLSRPHQLIFEGSVSQAVRYFPKNLNVAALLALAGFGPRKTRVRVIAYKKLPVNIHEVEILSGAGKMTFRTENRPHPWNPKTSALAVYSAQALLRKLFSPLSLGT